MTKMESVPKQFALSIYAHDQFATLYMNLLCGWSLDSMYSCKFVISKMAMKLPNKEVRD